MRRACELNSFKIKLEKLRELGVNPYPSELSFGPSEGLLCLRGRVTEIIKHSPEECILILNQNQRLVIKRENVGQKFEILTYIEAGDFIEAQGIEKEHNSIEAKNFNLISKACRKLPKISEIETLDPETRYRYPEENFILNQNLKEIFITRHKLKRCIREFLDKRGFVEVESPYLCPYPEIAPVWPFVTLKGKYAPSLYLRITNTEYMRRLLVAGFERIYQIGSCFRDEKPSWKHALEFTQLTFGVAYHNYTFLMGLIEELFDELIVNGICKEKVFFKGHEILLRPPFRKITVRDAIARFAGFDLDQCWEAPKLEEKLRELGLDSASTIKFSGYLAQHMLIDQIVDRLIAPNLIEPTYLYEYPYPLGGPAKEIEKNPRYKQRAELFIGGMEIANISTPQNDVIKLSHWYNETLRQKIEAGFIGDVLDEDYLSSMELGLPLSTTGALGFDRLLMILTEKERIEDVILFSWKPHPNY